MMLLIFTDLDGTLLNADDYRYDSALPVIQRLQQAQIPIIPVTSKTRSEVEILRLEIGLTDAFIVENGSAIFIPNKDNNLSPAETQAEADYQLYLLGCSYAESCQGLSQLSANINQPLTGFADLSETDISQLTGLSLGEAKRAKQREFTEPFITPKNIAEHRIETTVKQLGFQVVIGDRFSHLIGANAGKGNAVRWWVQQYQRCHPEITIQTIGLGNSPNDLPMLESVDIPIVIPGKNGPHPGLINRGWKIAAAAGSLGWGNEIELLL
ncbi:MAG: HAD-IIB family hydrolase [Microcoleaceae cyanobacterium]